MKQFIQKTQNIQYTIMTKKTNLSFAALYPFMETNEVLASEKEIRGQHFISWGDNNKFPFYLYDLYKNVSTLQSIIHGFVDYICGDEIISNTIKMTDDDMETLVYDMALSYMIYGGFAINVIRNKIGEVYKLESIDFRNVRSNKNNDVLYYSEDYNNKSYGRSKYIAYPKFGKDDIKNANSIFYYKNNKYQVYPIPLWNGAIKACEIEKSIDEYHLNNINNGFMGSVMVSLNNGVPDDDIKAQIEKDFNEKFCGKDNSGRVVISYSDDRDHQASIEQISTEDFSERYKNLAERSRQQIYTSFRCTPNLFGLPTETTGFNSQEYQDAFALFNKTVISPIQKIIVKSINKILGEGSVSITPFSVKFTEGTSSDKNIE